MIKFWNAIWLHNDDGVGKILMFFLKWAILICLCVLVVGGTIKIMGLMF